MAVSCGKDGIQVYKDIHLSALTSFLTEMISACLSVCQYMFSWNFIKIANGLVSQANLNFQLFTLNFNGLQLTSLT